MPYQIVRNDITKMKVDAIVNAANNSLLGGGGVDGAIHRAAGERLLAECRTLGGCETGKAKITRGYRLPAKYVIHTVGPVWEGGMYGEAQLLASCYRESLRLAAENGCETIAFPLISAGVYGYPKEDALKIALKTIREYLSENDLTVYMVIFDRSGMYAGRKLHEEIAEFIDDTYAEAHTDSESVMSRRRAEAEHKNALYGAMPKPTSSARADKCAAPRIFEEACREKATICGSLDLDDRLNTLDESFTQMVLRKIDEKGMKDSECYKRANIDRKLFSKIRSDLYYRPSKRTALALAVALELPMSEVRDLLSKAGFALSHSVKFDVIVEYFIGKGLYDVDVINATLFDYDQQLLG